MNNLKPVSIIIPSFSEFEVLLGVSSNLNNNKIKKQKF